MKNLKKPVYILSIAMVVLMIAQLALMFLPFFTFTPAPTRKEPNPVAQDYSLADYCWFESIFMEQFFEDEIDDYDINDHVTNPVLTFALALLSILFIFFLLKNVVTINYRSLGIIVVDILGHISSWLWAFFGIITFTTSQLLPLSSYPYVTYASLGVIGVGAVLAVVRTVIALLPKKKVAA